jgi:cellulose synthase (UDP-forming)
VVASAGYLAWRAGFTIDPAYWWIAIPLLAVEIHNALGLTMFTIALWDVDAGPSTTPRKTTDRRVAVLIPTLDEPIEVLMPTVAAAVALEPAHETWVLDDGRRPEVEQLAGELGARYTVRPDNEHAKAGNLNHALGVVDAEIVAVVDADHVAGPDFLRNTLGYFDDQQVALVQTPQDFYNLDSFEHEARGEGRLFNEEAVFYRVIAAGKNRWGAAFWCGTSALVRTEALREIGGVATGTVTEDIHTTIRLHRRGWKTVYHNEVLVRGLAPRTATEYMVQRRRWAAGAMQVLRLERPLSAPGLSFGQRLGYATTLWAWWDAWRSLAYVVLPILVIATGAVPIRASLAVFGPLFFTVLGIQFVALRLLARGYYPPVLSLMFEFLRMPAVIPGTLALLRPRGSRYRVTPKGASIGSRRRTPVPVLMRILLVASPLAMLWFGLSLAGLTPLEYPEPGVAIGACVFLAANLALVAGAAYRVSSPRFASDRRRGARLPVRLHGAVGEVPCTVLDVSLTGARLVCADAPVFEPSAEVAVTLDIPPRPVVLAASVQRHLQHPGGDVELGVRFEPDQRTAIAQLALALFAFYSRDGRGKASKPRSRRAARAAEPQAA